MESLPHLKFKIALEKWEFEQIHKLNYKTFVEEIHQHESNQRRNLVDKFDKENTYIICLQSTKLLGMISVRSKRPFSLDDKIKNLNSYLPSGRSLCEIRLLSVEKNYRNGMIFKGLVRLLYKYCKSHGYDLAVISGSVKQIKLYKSFGFVPFYKLVGTENAMFQPMYITLVDILSKYYFIKTK